MNYPSKAFLPEKTDPAILRLAATSPDASAALARIEERNHRRMQEIVNGREGSEALPAWHGLSKEIA